MRKEKRITVTAAGADTEEYVMLRYPAKRISIGFFPTTTPQEEGFNEDVTYRLPNGDELQMMNDAFEDIELATPIEGFTVHHNNSDYSGTIIIRYG